MSSNYPDLYRYLYQVAIEQKGVHSLTMNDPNKIIGNKDDKKFINDYINLELHNKNKYDQEKKNFLIQFKNGNMNNLEVHLTRDCQIIETGNHYVFLKFKLKSMSIIFYAQFKQTFSELPLLGNQITIKYTLEKSIDKLGKEDKIINCYYNVKYSIEIIYLETLNIDNNIFWQLNMKYKLKNEKNLTQKLSPDACILS